jgi:hypothetical protein
MKYLITIVIVLWIMFFIYYSEMALTALISGVTTFAVYRLCNKWGINNMVPKERPNQSYNHIPR